MVGLLLPFTATMSTGRCRTLPATSSLRSTASLASVCVRYLELSVLIRAARLMLSPRNPYFIRVMEPMFPARIWPVCRPQRHLMRAPPPGSGATSGKDAKASCISWQASTPASSWPSSATGVLNAARTSSPLNSRSVPPLLWMTSAILPSAADSRLSTSSGRRPRLAASKPSMSQKRMVARHVATPIVASTPSLSSRCTTQGGTNLDQDRTALRIDLNVVWTSCSSVISLRGFFSASTGGSRSMCARSREEIVIISSARIRSGCRMVLVKLLIFVLMT
mmetsp:Transcript_28149/g.79545  ORF Transcript_28149/g.79545 Transcript_28149/m.79545 type:complete len:278 (+) Transcript_28149:527-1360(+)